MGGTGGGIGEGTGGGTGKGTGGHFTNNCYQ